MKLSYSGAGFCGWQLQSNAPSVQGALQQALQTLLGCEVTVTGAGRTDTGVSARNYAAHFDFDGLLDGGRLVCKTNAILPPEIAVSEICPAEEGFHARFSAKSREYQYFIHQYKDPFLKDFSWYCRYNLDLDRMNEGCKLLIGTFDCSCFEKKGSDNLSSICRIDSALWESPSKGRLRFTIRANRFLRNMVRAIVGTTIDIGRGKREPDYISKLLESGSRSDAGQSVPARGLMLTDIEY